MVGWFKLRLTTGMTPTSRTRVEEATRERTAALHTQVTDPTSARQQLTASVLLGATIVTLIAAAGLVAFVGADSRWLVALGRVIVAGHAIPAGVPFASAPTAHWPNAIVLAELILHALRSALGDRGLMLAQLLASAIALTLVARDARAGGATAQGAAGALTLAALGALPSLSVARVQMFSLALFPLLLMLLRSEARAPSARIWLLIPLVALWSNLHGAVLVGLGITFVYLALVRLRQQPVTAVGVAIAGVGALCITPVGLRTLDYYDGVLTNVAAQRGIGLWAPLSPGKPFDVIMIVAALVLLRWVWRARPALWEVVAIVLLGAITVHASRSGIWLLLFLVGPASRGLTPKRDWCRVLPALATVAVSALVYASVRGPLPSGGTPAIVSRAVAASHGTPVLAADILAEQMALGGGRIWVGNPIDAFSQHDQAIYLDWLEGLPSGRLALGEGIRVVLTARRSAAQRLMDGAPGFVREGSDKTTVLYERAR